MLRVRRQPTLCLLQLPPAADRVASPRLVPGDRDVHEPLQKISLPRRRLAPFVLELLVRREVVPVPDQLQPGGEAHGPSLTTTEDLF